MTRMTEQDAAALQHLGLSTGPAAPGGFRVGELVEAACTASFDYPDGNPVAIVSRHGGRLGTVAHKDSAIVKARPDLWVPLTIPVAYPAPPKPAK